MTDYIHGVLWRVPPGRRRGRGLVGGPAPQRARVRDDRDRHVRRPPQPLHHPAELRRRRRRQPDDRQALRARDRRRRGARRVQDGLGEPAARRARRLRDRRRRPLLHHAAAQQPDRRGRSGRPRARALPESPGGGENGSAVPFDNPSSAMFLGRRLMIANQAFLSGDPAHQAILDVWIGVRGQREYIPRRAGRKPR